MLIALLVSAVVSLFSAGERGRLDDYSDHVKTLVTDEDRSRRALAVLDELRNAAQADADRLTMRFAELKALHRRHDATREEYERFFAVRDADLLAKEARILEARDRLKAVIHRDEWRAVFTVDDPE